jgi:hydrogenase-4 component F
VLLALGFLGLAHALLETTVGKARRRAPGRPGLGSLAVLGGASLAMLLGLSGIVVWLPGSAFVDALLRGLS